MQPTQVMQPFHRDGWVYEEKVDGWRILAYKDGDSRERRTTMSESMNPEVVTQFEHETWSRCAESYLDTFAGMTRETIPLLLEAAHIRRGSLVLEIGSGPDPALAAGAGGSGDRIVDRRRFLLTSLAGAFAVPLGAEGQQAGAIHRIGLLGPGGPGP